MYEQVSNDGHQILNTGGGPGGIPCLGRGGGARRGSCTVRSNASWVMVPWGPPCEQRHL